MVFIRIRYYFRRETAEKEREKAYHLAVLSYKNTLGYVNNNMFASAIRKINTPHDPCQVLRSTTGHVSVLISLNALSPAPCPRARKSIATLRPITRAITTRRAPLMLVSNFRQVD